MKKIIAVCPADDNNWEKYGKNLLASLRKFHSEEELPFIRLNNPNPADKNFWYRSAPIIGVQYLQEYETVLKLDADQLILGSLSDILDDKTEYDVGVVLNDPTYPIGVWDITHPNYYNNGLVVLKSKEFANHWLKLCASSHFDKYQYREQDFLTALCSDYFNYKVKVLDNPLKIYGEVVKSQWAQARMKDGKVMINDMQVCVIHYGGGSGDPSKGNYKIKFDQGVVDYIDSII